MFFRNVWSWTSNTGQTGVCVLVLRASVGTLFVHQSRHQLSPELDSASHKKAESWAASHRGILWNQLTRTSGHTSSCYTSYFCPIKAAPISLKRNLSFIWCLHCFPSLLALSIAEVRSLRQSKRTGHHVACFPKITECNSAVARYSILFQFAKNEEE